MIEFIGGIIVGLMLAGLMRLLPHEVRRRKEERYIKRMRQREIEEAGLKK